MVIKLKHIPKLLGIIKKYETDKNAKPIIQYVKKTFNNSPVQEATYPDFDELGGFCSMTGIIKFQNSIIEITDLGNKIFETFEKNNEFDSSLKKILRENCFLDGFLSKSIRESLSRFIKTGNEIWAPLDKVYNLFPEKIILPLLYECELLEVQGDRAILNPQHTVDIKIKKEKQVRLTQKQIDSQLKLMKKIGQIAEDLVVKFEKNRLKNASYDFESKKVQRISIDFANAGYDVASFNGSSMTGEFDRFIEVKGSSGKDFDLHWSSNEIKIASKLMDRYWIYFISEIDIDTGSSPVDPEIIQNPFLNLLSNPDFTQDIEGYHITKKSK